MDLFEDSSVLPTSSLTLWYFSSELVCATAPLDTLGLFNYRTFLVEIVESFLASKNCLHCPAPFRTSDEEMSDDTSADWKRNRRWQREGKTKKAVEWRSEGMERRMDNGEVKKSSEGQTAGTKACARLGAPMALTAFAKDEGAPNQREMWWFASVIIDQLEP